MVPSLADKNFDPLKGDPHHPSRRLKRIGRFWSVRVGLHHRALGLDGNEEASVRLRAFGENAEVPVVHEEAVSSLAGQLPDESEPL